MKTLLLNATKKPALYEDMKIPFWGDEHISSQMLLAHLNPALVQILPKDGHMLTLNVVRGLRLQLR